MSRKVQSTLGGLVLLGLISVAQATGPANVVINSEQRAAAGVLVAVRLGDELPIYFGALTGGTRDYIERTLRVLDAATSPAALKRARNGLVVGCPAGGTVKARLSSGRVLDLEWRECTLEISGVLHILNGPGQLTLCADDLLPDYVLALSVGDGRRNLVNEIETSGMPRDPDNRGERNLRLSGLIRIGRPDPNYPFDGSFAHAVDGFVHFYSKTRVATPGEVYQFTESRISAENAFASGIYEHGDLAWQEDLSLNSGKIVNWRRIGPVLDQPERIVQGSIRGNGLRTRSAGDYVQGSESYLVSGNVQYTWPDAAMACASGGYSFSTPVTLVHPIEFQSGVKSWGAGELRVNSTATARFSANADPSELGEMHVVLDVNRVGTFAYDGNSIWETALPSASQCSP